MIRIIHGYVVVATQIRKYQGTLGISGVGYPLVPASRNTGLGTPRYRLRELPGYARYSLVPSSRNTGVRSVPPGTDLSKYRGTLGTPRYRPLEIPGSVPPGTGFAKYRGTLGTPWYRPLEIPGYAWYPPILTS